MAGYIKKSRENVQKGRRSRRSEARHRPKPWRGGAKPVPSQGPCIRPEKAAMRLAVPAPAPPALPLLSPPPAQDAPDPVPSQCVAIAGALPKATYAGFAPAAPFATPAQAAEGVVAITYAGHSTYVIETPAGVRVATDFSGYHGADPLPRVVTMN